MLDINLKIKNRSQLHAGHRMRLRERLRKETAKNFNEHQMLEILLSFVIARKDTNDLAHMLINKFGSLSNVIHTPYDVLMEFNGLGDASATFLSCLPEIINYLGEKAVEKKLKINCTVDALETLRPMFNKVKKEKFIVLLMDGSDNLIHCETSKLGFDDKINISFSDITSLIKSYNAKKILIAHNHPKGVVFPSTEDLNFTKKLCSLLYFTEVKLLDHIIMTPNGDDFSFRRENIIDAFYKEISAFVGDSNK